MPLNELCEWRIIPVCPLYAPLYKYESKHELTTYEIFDNYLARKEKEKVAVPSAIGQVRVVSAKNLTLPTENIVDIRYTIVFMEKLIAYGSSAELSLNPQWNSQFEKISTIKECGKNYKFEFEVTGRDENKRDISMGYATLMVDLNKGNNIELQNHELILHKKDNQELISGSIFVDIELELGEVRTRMNVHTCEHLDLGSGALDMVMKKNLSFPNLYGTGSQNTTPTATPRASVTTTATVTTPM
jgi:hypothetical protein